jgi:CRISPR-associated protein Cmr4
MQENRYRWQAGGKTYACAGQGQENEKENLSGHCGKYDCPICVTFGFSKGSEASFQGLAQFSDARLLFFPVHSLAGPVWATCQDALRDAGMQQPPQMNDDGKVRVASGVKVTGHLNLGWLMLNVAGNDFSLDGQLKGVPDDIKNRAVLVSNKLFSHIVNDNLEVRTSVSIDPQTGAAAEGALFTYEAIPRASVLHFEVVVSHPKYYRIARSVEKNDTRATESVVPLSDKGHPEGNIDKVKSTVNNGLKLFESLGVGGMNTRGMGRLKVLDL